MNKTISVRIPKPMFSLIEEQASANKTSVTNHVRSLLISQLNKQVEDEKLDAIILKLDAIQKDVGSLAVEIA